MVRDIRKTLSYAFASYRHYEDPKFGARVLKAVSQGELALAIGLPILQAYFAAAVDRLSSVRDLSNPEYYLEGRLLDVPVKLNDARKRTRPVTTESRLSFERAFGINPEEQRRLEDELVSGLRFPHEVPGFNWDAHTVDLIDGPDCDQIWRWT